MEFRILGPLEVVADGGTVPIGSAKLRALLALLVIHRGEVVSIDEIVDALWGERPPANVAKSVQVYVSQLRKSLGYTTIETRGSGYAIPGAADALDAVQFEHLIARGRQLRADGRPGEAAAALAEALALWRGPPLADLAYESLAQAEIARLSDLQAVALEERNDAALAAGAGAELVPELEALVRRHPLRERLRSQLMLALYRGGRQADALAAYRDARSALTEELGIEPSTELRELHAAILRQDPMLAAPAAVPAGEPEGGEEVRGRSSRILAAVAAVVLAATAAVAVIVHERGHGSSARPAEALSSSFCAPLESGGTGTPQLLIVSDQELHGPLGLLGNQISTAVELVLRERHFRAGRYTVGYQACNDGTAQTGFATKSTCAANAAAYGADRSVVGVVGPMQSSCAAVMIPIAGRAAPGPLALISPSATQVGLTRSDPGSSIKPQRLYSAGVRNFVRMMPADDVQGAADAVFAAAAGMKVVAVVWEQGTSSIEQEFERATALLGVDVEARIYWVPDQTDLGPFERAVRNVRADGVFLAGDAGTLGPLAYSLRADFGGKLKLIGLDDFSLPGALNVLGTAANGLTYSVPGLPPEALPPPGQRFVARLRRALGGQQPHQYAVYAAQAATLLLDAIARSDGTRKSVLHELFSGKVHGGLLGDFAVTPTGDTTARQVTMYRVIRGRPRVVRIIEPPASLGVGG